MTPTRYLIVTYRRSVASDYWGQVRYEDGSEFEQLHADCRDDAIAQLTSVLVSASREKLDKKCERETFLYINGFGPNSNCTPDGSSFGSCGVCDHVNGLGPDPVDDEAEEVCTLHDIAMIWSAAVKRADVEIQARAQKAAAVREASVKAAAERARVLAAQEIERLKKLHGLT